MKKLWAHVLGLLAFGRSVVIELVEFEADAGEIVATVRQRRDSRGRCGLCGASITASSIVEIGKIAP